MSLATRLTRVRRRIDDACAGAGREPGAARLLAVSKTVDAAMLAQAAALGQAEFGESYVQEALPKIAALAQLPGLTWHFIGPVQSNKTRDIAAHFDWVHGVDRLKIAQRLSAQRADGPPPLQACVQVNISGEASKSGCAPAEAVSLCQAVAVLPRLRLRGLMAIPEAEAADARAPYAALKALFDRVRAALAPEHQLHFDTLSAGMSDDLEQAIAEGSTLVRVGTDLFGAR